MIQYHMISFYYEITTFYKIASLFNSVDNDSDNNKYEDEQTFRLICNEDISGVSLLDSYDAKMYLQ